MAINITFDNDRSTLLVLDKFVLDESSGLQTPATLTDTGNDSDLTITDATVVVGNTPDSDLFDGTLSGAGFSASFLSFLNAPTVFTYSAFQLTDVQLAYAATVEGAVSATDFVKVTKDTGETVSDLFFSDSAGHALDGDQVTGMQTLDGQNVYLWSNGDYCIATTSSTAGDGRIVAAFYLNEAVDHLTAQVQMVTFEPLKHPDGTSADDELNFTNVLNVSASGTISFNFDSLPSGNFLWTAVGSNSAALLITGQDLNVNDTAGKLGDLVKGGSDPSDSVNTSQAAPGSIATIGINSQHFADTSSGGSKIDGPIAVCTLVSGFVPLATTAPAVGGNVNQIDYSNYINAPSAKFLISQATGSSSIGVSLKITLWEAGGGDGGLADHAPADLLPEEKYGSGLNAYIGNDDTDQNLKDDWAVAVGTVTVTRGATTYTFTGAGGTQGGITVTISGNSIVFSGLQALDTVGFAAADTSSLLDGTFNRFDIQCLANSNAFDIGRIDLDQGLTVSQPVGGSLIVQDDGPSPSGLNATFHVDEDAMAGSGAGDGSTGIVETDGNPATLDDDGDGIDGEQDEVTFTQAQLGVTVNAGTDSPPIFSLVSSIAAGTAVKTTGGADVFSKGDQVFWRVSSGVLQGVVNAGTGSERVIFTITVNTQGTLTKTDDTFTFDLKDQLDHGNGAGDLANLLLNITPAFSATDADGDPVSFGTGTPIRMQVENDVPTFTAQISDGTVDFATDSTGTVTHSLNGLVGADDTNATNTSQSPSVKQYTFVNNSWTEPHDVFPDLDGVLSADGTKITFYSTSVTADQGPATAVYEITLNQTANSGAGSYIFTVLQEPPNNEINLDFTDLPSGQNLLGVIAFDKTNVVGGVLPDGGLLVFPNNPDLNPDGTFTNASGTINTSKGGGPVTIGNGNQAFDHLNEGAYFCYVDNPVSGSVGGVGLNQTSADDADTAQFDGTNEALRASVEIVQASGAGTAKRPGPSLQIFAYDINPQTVGHFGDAGVETDSDAFIDNPVLAASGVEGKIMSVKVLDANGNVVEWRTNDDQGATNPGSLTGGSSDTIVGISFVLDNANGAGTADDQYSVVVSQLKAGYTIEWTTQDPHDLALVENRTGSYDIGGFNIFNGQNVDPQDIDFKVQINDYDNDSFTSSLAEFSVHINGVSIV